MSIPLSEYVVIESVVRRNIRAKLDTAIRRHDAALTAYMAMIDGDDWQMLPRMRELQSARSQLKAALAFKRCDWARAHVFEEREPIKNWMTTCNNCGWEHMLR